MSSDHLYTPPLRARGLAKLLKAGVAALFLCVSGAYTTEVVLGQGATVVINEVLYDAGGDDTGHEWLELFNAGGEPVDIGGWTVERGGTSFAKVATIPSGTTLVPGTFYLIGESAVSAADLQANLTLQNGGSATDGIRLVSSSGVVVDVLLYDTPNTGGLPDESGSAGTSFASDVSEGHALARVPDGADTNQSAADFHEVTNLTPGGPNSSAPTATPTATASATPSVSAPPPSGSTPVGVVVNEALPNPVGSDADGEFIELLNPTSSSVSLGGARLDDSDGGSAPYTLPAGTVIAAGGYAVFAQKQTGVVLNNEGDSVRLLAADGRVLSTLTYSKVPREGAAWARQADGGASWTQTPTPGSTNVFTALVSSEDAEKASPSPSSGAAKASTSPLGATAAPRALTTQAAKGSPLGSKVELEGVVIFPSGVLAPSAFYLSDATGGVRIDVTSGEVTLALGDRVRVVGLRGSIDREPRIRAAATDVQRRGTGAVPQAQALTIEELSDARIGTLVVVGGSVIQNSGRSFTLDDGSGAIRVSVDSSAGWKPSVRKGDAIRVTGVLSRAGEAYRVLPRQPDDIVISGDVLGTETARTANSRSLSGQRRVSQAQGSSSEQIESPEATLSPSPEAPPSSAATDPSSTTPRRKVSKTTLTLWGIAGLLGVWRLIVWRRRDESS